MITYVLECWNPNTKKYEKFGEYDREDRAKIMFNKPYFEKHTRRLLSIETKTIAIAKRSKL